MKFDLPLLGILLATALSCGNARADYWELSAGANYSKSTFSGGSYSWNRRLGFSIGYNFTDSSTIEVAYQKSYEQDHYEGFEDSYFDDQVYSANFVWNILGKNAQIQPYLKAGFGQLNRHAYVRNSAGQTQDTDLGQLTEVAGAGLKFYLTKTFAIRAEGTTYLTSGKIGTWKDNFGATFGVSFYY